MSTLTPKQEKREVATARQAYPELKRLCDHLGIDISKAVSLSIHFDIEGGITYDLNAYATLASNTGSS
jgi:predicted NAD/FAD-binding protein